MGDEHTHGVDEPKHANDGEAYNELEGISVEFEVHRLGVEDGSHQVTFSCIEPCVKICAIHCVRDIAVLYRVSAARKQVTSHKP